MIDDPSKVKFSGDETLIHIGGSETDEAYLSAVQSLTLSGDIVKRHAETIKIVYTPLMAQV